MKILFPLLVFSISISPIQRKEQMSKKLMGNFLKWNAGGQYFLKQPALDTSYLILWYAFLYHIYYQEMI